MNGVEHTLATHGWWILSRSSGIVAFCLVTVSVLLGLAMAGKPLRRPGLNRALLTLHEQTALAALIAIGLHGTGLLLDPWLRPGVSGVAVPFAHGPHAFWVGLGVIASYLALLLGPTFYLRKQIGPRLWRKAHRVTAAIYVLGLLHALGAGSDTSSPVFIAWVLVTGIPIALLFTYRVMKSGVRGRDLAGPRPRRSQPVLAEGTDAWPDSERETRAPRSRDARAGGVRRSSS